MLNIHIKTIPDKEQRYDTVGDYWKKDGVDEIRVSSVGKREYEFLVAIHEMVEQYLCENNGIDEDSIMKFDTEFQRLRQSAGAIEPGDNPTAPYYKQHIFASKIERQIADHCGLDWDKYNEYLNKFYDRK